MKYNSPLEAECERCRSVGKLYRAVGVCVVVGHGAEERGGLRTVSFLHETAILTGNCSVSGAATGALTLSTGGRSNLSEMGGAVSVRSCCSWSE